MIDAQEALHAGCLRALAGGSLDAEAVIRHKGAEWFAGLGTPRPYDLRHSFASLLIREQRVSWIRGRALWIPITSAVTAVAILSMCAATIGFLAGRLNVIGQLDL